MEQSRSFVVILSVTLVLAGFFGVAALLSTPGAQASITGSDAENSSAIARFFRGDGTTTGTTADTTAGTTADTTAGPITSFTDDTADQLTVDTGIDAATVNSILADAASLGQPTGSEPELVVESTSTVSVSSSGESGGAATSRTQASPAKELGGPNYVPPVLSNRSQTATTQAASSTPAANRAAATASSSTASSAAAGSSAAAAGSAARQPSGQAAVELNEEEYWIQVISSPSRDRVELARRDLENFGLGGRISSYKVDHVDYYRLRYGPYTEEAEAEKFLAWLRELPSYRSSFISLEQRSAE